MVLADWNATLGKRWNRFLQAVRRGEASVKVRGNRVPCDVQYFRVYETQERGALHIHVPLVSGDESPIVLSMRKLRALAIVHGFGHEVHWDPMVGGKHEASKLGAYVAKYVSKSCDERASVPWRAPGDDPDKGKRFRTWVASRRWQCSMAQVRAARRRRVVEQNCEHAAAVDRIRRGLAGGEPLDSLHASYTVERAPPDVQLRLLTPKGGGGGREYAKYTL